MRTGYRSGELWVRCPFCGDSKKDPRKCHFSVNDFGIYHCFLCGVGGKLKANQMVGLWAALHEQGIVPQVETNPLNNLAYIIDQLKPGPGSNRGSYLERFHLNNSDAFLAKDPYTQEVLGVSLISQNQTRQLIGQKGFGFRDELVSTPNYPLVVVEGPYDVQEDFDICTFGLPTPSILRELSGQYLMLCPDGDVWVDHKKTNLMLKVLSDSLGTRSMAQIVGVQILEPELDPDDVPFQDRKVLTIKEVFESYGTQF